MFMLLSGTPPFDGKNDNLKMRAVRKGKYEFKRIKWQHVSELAKDLIRKILVKDTSIRYSAQECLQHEWFNLIESDDFEPKKLSKAIKHLKAFKAEQKLQQAALTYMVSHLISDEEIKDLKEVFDNIDKNNDGQLSLSELIEG